MNKNEKKFNLYYCLAQAFYWSGFCYAVTFAATYLQGLGYTNSQLGVITAAGFIAGFLLGPVIASFIDRYEKLSSPAAAEAVIALQGIAVAILLLKPEKGISVSVFFAVSLALSMVSNNLNTTLCVEIERRGIKMNYGFARGIGSLGFVLVSSVSGLIIQKTSVNAVSVMALIFIVLRLLINRLIMRELKLLPDVRAESKNASRAESSGLLEFLKKYPKFTRLLAGTTLVFVAHCAVTNFMANVVKTV